MPTVEEDIVVDAPVERVFEEWADYERFPMFMDNVKEVRKTGPGMTHWVAEAAGETLEWDARTVAETERLVAWTAYGEVGQSGAVRFEPLGEKRTRIKVRLNWDLPNDAKEAVASALGIDDRAVKRDLQNFKAMVEGHD